MARFSFNPRPFNPDEFGSNFGPQPALPGFDSSQLSFSTPQTSFPGAGVDTSNIGFGPDNTPQFGVGGPGFGTGGGGGSDFSGLDIARLGIGGLQAGAGIFDAFNKRKQLKLAREAFNFQKSAFNKNFGLAERGFANQVTAVNNRIADQNAFKRAQGRTDLAKLVV